MEIEASGLSRAEAHKILAGSVVPRPIAWITTRSEAGIINAAPFSSFVVISQDPPMVLFQSEAGEREKDTARNIRTTKQFVVNIPDQSLLEQLHLCSTPLGPQSSEPEIYGIALAASRSVIPPRIAAAPICFECVLHSHFDVGNEPHTVFIGSVVHFFLSDEVYIDGKIDQRRLNPIARIGGPWYAKLGEYIQMPTVQTQLEVKRNLL